MKAIYIAAFAALLMGCASGESSPAKDAHSPPPPDALKISGSEITNQFVDGEECNIVKANEQSFWFIDNVKGTTNNRFTR